MQRAANSRGGVGLRVFLAKDQKEDFLNTWSKYYSAWVNNQVWTGPRVIEEERYLEIHEYDESKIDSNNKINSRVLAVFPVGTWLGVRELESDV
jgi:hypothetical protein